MENKDTVKIKSTETLWACYRQLEEAYNNHLRKLKGFEICMHK